MTVMKGVAKLKTKDTVSTYTLNDILDLLHVFSKVVKSIIEKYS